MLTIVNTNEVSKSGNNEHRTDGEIEKIARWFI